MLWNKWSETGQRLWFGQAEVSGNERVRRPGRLGGWGGTREPSGKGSSGQGEQVTGVTGEVQPS